MRGKRISSNQRVRGHRARKHTTPHRAIEQRLQPDEVQCTGQFISTQVVVQYCKGQRLKLFEHITVGKVALRIAVRRMLGRLWRAACRPLWAIRQITNALD